MRLVGIDLSWRQGILGQWPAAVAIDERLKSRVRDRLRSLEPAKHQPMGSNATEPFGTAADQCLLFPDSDLFADKSRMTRRANNGLTRFWSGHAEMGKILFPVCGAEIWKRRELDATSRPFSRPTWLDTAG